MAGSRVHKLGSIFQRLTGLIESEAVKDWEKPIWYDVYRHHPPMYDPRFDRRAPDMEVKQILYEEDFIRAEIHKVAELKYFDLESKEPSQTQIYIQICEKIMKEKGVSVKEAIKELNITNREKKKDGTQDLEVVY